MNKSALNPETLNSITHAPGILFGIVFIPLLIERSLQCDANLQIAGTVAYGLFFLATFTLSTLYHAFRKPRRKVMLRILDHISIYFFIAGTYTPFVLHFIRNTTGIVLLSLLWFFAITGSFFKIYYANRSALISVAAYVFMGLMFVFVQKPFFEHMPGEIIVLIYYGVGLYLLGVIFFLWRKWKYHHAVWHLLVLAGGICHFKAIWLSIT